jgi:hypothetical protein
MESLESLELLKKIIYAQETLENARLRDMAFTRNRKMPFADALCFALDMQKSALQNRLNLYFKNPKSKEELPLSQQAFSKLRSQYDHSPFVAMHRALMEKEYCAHEEELSTWRRYHLFGVDGSYMQLPRVEVLYREFGTHGQETQCPMTGISVLFDVMYGWALNPIITTAGMNEREECEKHIDFLCDELPHIANNINPHENTCIISQKRV